MATESQAPRPSHPLVALLLVVGCGFDGGGDGGGETGQCQGDRLGNEWIHRDPVTCEIQQEVALIPGIGRFDLQIGSACVDLSLHAILLGVVQGGAEPGPIYEETDQLIRADFIETCEGNARRGNQLRVRLLVEQELV